jgi:Cd2+/Zn2+-exporting ATPase
MLIHQLSVLVVIANAMRLLRVPRGPGGRRPVPAAVPATA